MRKLKIRLSRVSALMAVFLVAFLSFRLRFQSNLTINITFTVFQLEQPGRRRTRPAIRYIHAGQRVVISLCGLLPNGRQ